MKKELNNKELDKVNGGIIGDQYNVICPKCKKGVDEGHSEILGSGCDKYTQYTCPHCDHVWTDE